jgi:hypothetical protein
VRSAATLSKSATPSKTMPWLSSRPNVSNS